MKYMEKHFCVQTWVVNLPNTNKTLFLESKMTILDNRNIILETNKQKSY